MPDPVDSGVAQAGRSLPQFPRRAELRRSISFITVAFSGELQHNLLRSSAVHDPRNELIVVDNRENLHFDTLGAAWMSGVEKARHPLIALVHEDVLLLPDWQGSLEASLDALEVEDSDWGLIGVAGWDAGGRLTGCWSDPHGNYRELVDHAFAPVVRIDEQFMLVRRDSGLRLDPALPSIHFIGHDLAEVAREAGRRTYVVDAPTVHKFADAEGQPIQRAADSPKIQGRKSLTYLADYACSEAYFRRKWARLPAQAPCQGASPTHEDPHADAPVILLARGGGGSRLLACLGRDAGIHIGNDLNVSGDAMELAQPMYQWLLARWRYPQAEIEGLMRARFLDAVRGMRERSGFAADWGFKLPESMLMVDRLLALFPRARCVHMVRDPATTCLRRTHMTARTDNHIGQAALLAAYREQGLDARPIVEDPAAMRMARTTRHQLSLACRHLASLPADRILQLRFESLMQAPGRALEQLAKWLRPQPGAPIAVPASLEHELDPQRPQRSAQRFEPAIEAAVLAELEGVRRMLGYLPPG